MEKIVVGENVPNASPRLIQYLINEGLLYVGKDNQLHVVENKNMSTPPTKVE